MQIAEKHEILRVLVRAVPQFEQLLEEKLQEELKDLPSISADKVQVYQGRAKMLQELLAEIQHFSGTTANRTAKPNFSTP